MLALPIMVVGAALLIWGFFSPSTPSWVFLSLGIVGALWLLVTNITFKGRVPSEGQDPLHLTADEVEVFKAYPVYFLHPFVARQYSSALSFVQAACFAWIALMLWHRMWVQTGLFVVLIFLAMNMVRLLNPGHFFRYHSQRGKLTPVLQERLANIESVENKLTAHRESLYNKLMDARKRGAAAGD